MTYFTSIISRDEILQLIRQVDINVFCLWQGEHTNHVYGVIKDSAYEFFIVACSMNVVRHIQYLNPEEIADMISKDEPMIICGNPYLMEQKIIL